VLRRLLCAALSAGVLLGGAAPVVASESAANVAFDGQKKAKSPKKGKSKKGKKAKKKNKKAAKKKAPAKGKSKKAKKVS